jgi:hypothetical protein
MNINIKGEGLNMCPPPSSSFLPDKCPTRAYISRYLYKSIDIYLGSAALGVYQKPVPAARDLLLDSTFVDLPTTTTSLTVRSMFVGSFSLNQ